MTDNDPAAQAQSSTPNATLQRLETFVGDWVTEVSVGGETLAHGRARFRWMEGEGGFLVYHADAEPTDYPSGTLLIGGDDAMDSYSVLYFDSRGISRIYQMSLGDGVWKMWRDAPGFLQRFTGVFSKDGKTIKGAWETSSDGSHWELDFDLTYTRVK